MSTRIEVVVSEKGSLTIEVHGNLYDHQIKEIYRDAIKRLGALETERRGEEIRREPFGFAGGTSAWLERSEEPPQEEEWYGEEDTHI